MKFNEKLVLNRYLLDQLGFDSFEKLTEGMKGDQLEYTDENGVTGFYHSLTNHLFEVAKIPKHKLLEYDNNIVMHTNALKRELKWKYFQYLTLLFTEIYLDKYFNNKEFLLAELNEYLVGFNAKLNKADKLVEYKISDLNKLAFWSATGSGKTLLMHINTLQFKHYADGRLKINKTLLLTPNEGLSNQHLLEFEESGLEAEIFSKDSKGLFENRVIEIIEFSKLKTEDGDKSVAVDSFEDNNLVFIDEGHRGSGGDTWKINRDQLSENGFAFEYSATFGQAINAATGTKKKELTQEYAKSVLFDYSYKFFYNDGYGKNFSILNLEDDSDNNVKEHYLVASLLTFYQQTKVFLDKEADMKQYNIHKPLLVYVGNSVNAVRKENNVTVSDVVDTLLFLNNFVNDKSNTIIKIRNIMQGSSGLVTATNEDIFHNKFPYLKSLNLHNLQAEEVYKDLLEKVFHSQSGVFHLDDLKGVDGEIGLRVGENEYFGVINVGDSSALIKLCEENGIKTEKKDFSNSLFKEINRDDSKLNVLIGSKKFTEGWSSWRVSCMGLMNMGKSEGSQVIQLFGRGVRLMGKNFSLKRSTEYDNNLLAKYLSVETLTIFGLKATYMAQFKEYLENEGVPTEDKIVFTLPVVYDNTYKSKNLMVPKVKHPEGKTYKQCETLNLELSDNIHILKKVKINLYNKLAVLESEKNTGIKVDFNVSIMPNTYFHFLNRNEIFFELIKFKNERRYYNLNISKENLETFYNNSGWYQLEIPKEKLVINKFSDYRDTIQPIIISLLKRYINVYYSYNQNSWESKFLDYANIEEFGSNFIDEQRIEVLSTETELIEHLKVIEEAIRNGKEGKISRDTIKTLYFDKHFYNPLIYKGRKQINVAVKPVHLNEGEKDFIEDLDVYLKKEAELFMDSEIYLLRNQSKTGVGIFTEVNFYPDFIMWVITGDKQKVVFIDPKGITHEDLDGSPKLNLSSSIKNIENRLKEKNGNITLDSFIVTCTSEIDLLLQRGNVDFDNLLEKNVVFQSGSRGNYIEQIFEKLK